MQPSEEVALELQCHSILRRIAIGETVEDDLLELKSDFPLPADAARRVAAQANSARGRAFLWLVGVHERKGVVPVSRTDAATWFAEVSSHFDGSPPSLAQRVVDTSSGSVHVLHFTPTTPPFVVKFATQEGRKGQTREVPWREGTSTRSATRLELLELLSKPRAAPSVRLLGATLYGNSTTERNAQLSVRLYAESAQAEGAKVVFPKRDVHLVIVADGARLTPQFTRLQAGKGSGSADGVVLIAEAGTFTVYADLTIPFERLRRMPSVVMSLRLREKRSDANVQFDEELIAARDSNHPCRFIAAAGSFEDAFG